MFAPAETAGIEPEMAGNGALAFLVSEERNFLQAFGNDGLDGLRYRVHVVFSPAKSSPLRG
jgi:hypothetical protein